MPIGTEHKARTGNQTIDNCFDILVDEGGSHYRGWAVNMIAIRAKMMKSKSEKEGLICTLHCYLEDYPSNETLRELKKKIVLIPGFPRECNFPHGEQHMRR